MGVTRTSEPLTVSDDDLDRAIAVVEAFLRDEGLEPELEIAVDEDPEDSTVSTVTILSARIPASFEPDTVIALLQRGWRSLRDAELGYPARPLLFDVRYPGED